MIEKFFFSAPLSRRDPIENKAAPAKLRKQLSSSQCALCQDRSPGKFVIECCCVFLPATESIDAILFFFFGPVKTPKSSQSSTQAVSVVIPQSGRSIKAGRHLNK